MLPELVILCGGRGSRLGLLTEETPKPLLKIGDSPFLRHLLMQFQKEGFERFILAAHYLAGQFQAFAKAYASLFPKMKVVVEESPLGTGGALRNAASHVDGADFIVLNGDAFLAQPLPPVLNFHFQEKSVFTLVAVKAEKVEGRVNNKGGLEIDEENTLVHFNGHEREKEQWVNGGLYVANRNKVLSWPEGFYNLEGKLNSLLIPDKARVFRSEASLLDIGTPECLKIAERKYAADSLSPC